MEVVCDGGGDSRPASMAWQSDISQSSKTLRRKKAVRRAIGSCTVIGLWVAFLLSYLRTSFKTTETTGAVAGGRLLHNGDRRRRRLMMFHHRDEEHNARHEDVDNTQILCRIVVFDTVYETGDGSLLNEEELSCIPLIRVESEDGNGETHVRESDDAYRLVAAQGVESATAIIYRRFGSEDIKEGQLHVAFSGADVDTTSQLVTLTDTTTMSQVEISVDNNQRKLVLTLKSTNPSVIPIATMDIKEKQSGTKGTRSVKVIRVSVLDSQVTATAQELEQTLFGGTGVSFVSQYDACSFGQLNWIPSPSTNLGLTESPVIDVQLDNPAWSYDSPSAVVSEAQIVLKETFHLDSAADLADNVMFCLPPGIGFPSGGNETSGVKNKDNWAASAGVNYFRSTYNNEWCTSLTATMHELGHNIGLVHSNEDGVAYADSTGYMAAGYKNKEWPLKCFNGHKNWILGWYKSRLITVDPLREGSRLVKLAAFVDFEKTSFIRGEYVLANIIDTFFLQFNRAKGFNRDTEEKRNQVTVTEAMHGGSENRAGLKVGESYFSAGPLSAYTGTASSSDEGGNHAKLVIEVCESLPADSALNTPDIVTVSIGVGESLCRRSKPTLSPSVAPTYSPTARTTEAPSKAPTNAPTVRPTKRPTKGPTRGPTLHPTKPPTYSHTPPPSLRPSTLQPTTQKPKPTVIPSAKPTSAPHISPTVPVARCGLLDQPPCDPPHFRARPDKVDDPTVCGLGVACASSPTPAPSFRSPTEAPAENSVPTGMPMRLVIPTKSPVRCSHGLCGVIYASPSMHPASLSPTAEPPVGCGGLSNPCRADSPTLNPSEEPTVSPSAASAPSTPTEFSFGNVFAPRESVLSPTQRPVKIPGRRPSPLQDQSTFFGSARFFEGPGPAPETRSSNNTVNTTLQESGEKLSGFGSQRLFTPIQSHPVKERPIETKPKYTTGSKATGDSEGKPLRGKEGESTSAPDDSEDEGEHPWWRDSFQISIRVVQYTSWIGYFKGNNFGMPGWKHPT